MVVGILLLVSPEVRLFLVGLVTAFERAFERTRHLVESNQKKVRSGVLAIICVLEVDKWFEQIEVTNESEGSVIRPDRSSVR